MIKGEVKTSINFSKVLAVGGYFSKRLDQIMQAGIFIVEDKYVSESPGDTGNLKQEIKPKKRGTHDYIVESRAETKDGKPYPLFLYTGTGTQKGKPDAGYTSGRVRANDVAYGIGGIRPNKAADRAKEKAERPYINFVKKAILKEL